MYDRMYDSFKKDLMWLGIGFFAFALNVYNLLTSCNIIIKGLSGLGITITVIGIIGLVGRIIANIKPDKDYE